MPHLQFELSEAVEATDVESFAEWLRDRYSAIMETGTDHIGVTIRNESFLTMGRAEPGAPIVFLDADVRTGRTFEQRRTLAEAIVQELHDRWHIPTENIYVVFTEHPGEDFHLDDGALAAWGAAEGTGDSDPLS